ncbi:alpha/beta fold hydrolase [Pseudonocardia xishanensis]|uniref:VOC domain-containing protein n=1 Tax=Pseudonocardia xishanensis TaxID=630995 RepID=A0ABP8S0W4_9PSEU
MTAISGVHHVKLPVTDVARSGAWYERVLGFTTAIEFVEDGVLRGVALGHPSGVQIALRHDPERAAAMSGFDAVALAVPDRAAVAGWQRRLDEMGEPHGEVLTGHAGGAVLVGVRDPDGVEIRLYTDETAPEHRLQVAGGEITWTDSGGDGPLVLLVHAGVFGAWFDRLVAEPALDALRVVSVRRAGYGTTPTRALSFADHAAHCAALLDELGGQPATVVGHSSGSAIALQLAADRPDLVRGLVLAEPPLLDPLADPADLDALHATAAPVIGGAIGAAAAGDLPSAYDAFMDLVCGPDHRAVVAAALGEDGLDRAVRESAFFFADEIGAASRWTFDAKVDAPVLLVQGGDSPPVTHHLVAHLAGLLPDARVATIDGDNHLLPLRSPAALARLVAEHTG